MVSFVVEMLFRVLASITSISVTLSMIPSIYQIYCNKDTAVASVLPLLGIVATAHVWMLNGVTIKNWFPMVAIFTTSDIIGIGYVTVFYCFARDRKTTLRNIIITSTILCLVTVYAILANLGYTNQSIDGVNTTIGILGFLAGVSMYCSPFERIMKVLHYKSAVFIPIPMVAAGALNNAMWIVYCPMIDSWFLFGLNVLCLVICSINISLYIIYNPKTHPLHLEDDDRDEDINEVEPVFVSMAHTLLPDDAAAVLKTEQTLSSTVYNMIQSPTAGKSLDVRHCV